MKKVNVIVAGLVAAASLSTGVAVNAQNNSAKCTVEASKLGSWGSTFNVSGNKVSTKFKVKGTNCTTPVTLAVWERPTAEGINDQKLFNYVTSTYTPGTYTLSSNLPQCMYQADLVAGANPTAADGTANYQYQNGEFVDGGLRDFIKGGAGVCEKEVPETPVTPETPETPVIPETPETPEKPVTPAAEVKTLPSTGPGSIIASTMGLSTSAGLAYNLIQSRRKLK